MLTAGAASSTFGMVRHIIGKFWGAGEYSWVGAQVVTVRLACVESGSLSHSFFFSLAFDL